MPYDCCPKCRTAAAPKPYGIRCGVARWGSAHQQQTVPHGVRSAPRCRTPTASAP
ncbi:MAG: hypothetical protein IJV22_08095 [Bacteroidales bacterium]|nr:hypothetical protein [Bacteroidales bacterium]